MASAVTAAAAAAAVVDRSHKSCTQRSGVHVAAGLHSHRSPKAAGALQGPGRTVAPNDNVTTAAAATTAATDSMDVATVRPGHRHWGPAKRAPRPLAMQTRHDADARGGGGTASAAAAKPALASLSPLLSHTFGAGKAGRRGCGEGEVACVGGTGAGPLGRRGVALTPLSILCGRHAYFVEKNVPSMTQWPESAICRSAGLPMPFRRWPMGAAWLNVWSCDCDRTGRRGHAHWWTVALNIHARRDLASHAGPGGGLQRRGPARIARDAGC